MQDAPSFRTVHDGLLQHYVSTVFSSQSTAQQRLAAFRTLVASYLPDSPTFEECFRLETSLSSPSSAIDDAVLLKEIYDIWRRRDALRATLAYAGWLVSVGKGKEASDVIQRSRAEVGAGEKRQALDEGWRRALDQIGLSKGGEDGEGSDSGEEGGDEDVEMQE